MHVSLKMVVEQPITNVGYSGATGDTENTFYGGTGSRPEAETFQPGGSRRANISDQTLLTEIRKTRRR
jgi:hypothetical protein